MLVFTIFDRVKFSFMGYSIWKILHLFFVLMFLGNIITGLFWGQYAHRTKDFEFIGKIFRGIIKSDRIFTIPGIIGLTTAGIFGAMNGGYSLLRTGWIFWSLVLFSVSGIIFIWLAPMQKKICEFVEENKFSDETWDAYKGMFFKWDLLGILATITPLVAFVLMVLKPDWPGL